VAERDAVERLDAIIEAIVSGRPQPQVVDADLAMLAAVAADRREMPRPEFKNELRRTLMPTAEAKPALHSVVPYLVVKSGDRIIEFMQRTFGAQLHGRHPRPDGTVQHAELQIGDSLVELGEGTAQFPPQSMAIHVYVDDVDATYKRALEAGAESMYAPTDQPYRDRDAIVIDESGNHWHIATHKEAPKPPSYRSVTPFIHIRGTDRLIEWLKKAFDGEELGRFVHEGLIAHAVVRIGDSIVEMGEGPGHWKPLPAHIHLFVGDSDAVYAQALAAGATVLYPIEDMPYGERSGGVTDPFGNQWFIATPK